MSIEDPTGHDESGRPVPCEDFDYARVDRDLFGDAPADLSELSQEDADRAILLMRVLLQWVWKNGSKNPEGITLRAIVVCWIFLKELRPLELSAMARGFGKDKQSLGRHVDDFKRCFPTIRTPHMRPLKDE
ncbi:MAG: hypothetical protein KGL39_27845 [Patescibacteria group bacterium]|nr:hypothetical protein [Patescibacteria group bacterium]